MAGLLDGDNGIKIFGKDKDVHCTIIVPQLTQKSSGKNWQKLQNLPQK